VHPSAGTTPWRRVALAALVAFGSILAIGSVTVGAPPAGAANWAPVHSGDFPDPSVMFYNGVYYAFATQSTTSNGSTINVQVSTSLDGVTWSELNNVDALPNLPSWAQEGNTWAPSVTFDNTDNDFVMFYAATDTDSGDQCIGRATASTPGGPYVDDNAEPVICQTGMGGSIDPDIFTDNNGAHWLLWKNDGNHIATSTTIWSLPLTSGYQLGGNVGQAVPLLTDDAAWQSGIIEGPSMFETTAGSYYLFYSASQVDSTAYGIGWASCGSGPSGACTDQSLGGPLLGTQPGVSGPGGPDVFTMSGGQTVMAFAGWQGTTIGYLSCGIRPMYLADVSFGAGNNGPPSITPNNANEAPATNPSCGRPAPAPGYWQVASDGGVFTFGAASFYGSTGSMHLNRPVVGMAVTPDDHGYWLVASDGGVFAYGDAGFYGSTGSMTLNKPIIGMISTLDGKGYWLIASDGGVFAFGDAHFYGSAGSENLPYPVTAAAASFLGGGYWMVDSNGQVYSYGDARYEGAPPFAPGGYAITGMSSTSNANGYWLASRNGNVAPFGNAAYYGSQVGAALNAPIVGMSATFDGAGYWLQGSDGGIFSYGDAPFLGSMGGKHLNAPMVGIAAM
jgi:Glycosyl hydrolases family 43